MADESRLTMFMIDGQFLTNNGERQCMMDYTGEEWLRMVNKVDCGKSNE